MSRIRVLGVGNAWGGDDAAGPQVARRLRGRVPPHVDVLEQEGEPAALIDAWAGADEVVLVDAVRSGAPPGTVHRLVAGDGPLPAALARRSTHALSVADAIELARALDRVPPRLEILGIEGRRFTAGSELTPEVEHAVRDVCRELESRLRDR